MNTNYYWYDRNANVYVNVIVNVPWLFLIIKNLGLVQTGKVANESGLEMQLLLQDWDEDWDEDWDDPYHTFLLFSILKCFFPGLSTDS